MTKDERRSRGLYWDRAYKLVEGCTKVSAGCDNCWSETETVMRSNHPNEKISQRADDVLGPCEPGFSGHIIMREDNLDLPLRTKKGTVFSIWNDLFHEDVTDDFRDRAYAVMAQCPQHTFLVLTKRAEGMAAYWAEQTPRAPWRIQKAAKAMIDAQFLGYHFPFCNVWHGVTVEDQQRADERIPHLLKVPGKRFLSIEPMLGPVDIHSAMCCSGSVCDWCGGHREAGHDCYEPGVGIHAVLLGGESGSHARPMNPTWARSVRDQCVEAGVPFFFKQNGEWVSVSEVEGAGLHHEFPDGATVRRIGKKKAGRTLDDCTHDNLPW